MANPYFLASNVDKWLIALGMLLALAECVVDPAVTIIIGKIFNGLQDVIGGKMDGSVFLNKLQTYIYWLVGLTFYSAVINSCGYMLWVSLGFSMGHTARLRLYRVFIYKSSSWFDEKSSLSGIAAMHFKDIQDLEVASGITAYEIVAMSCGIVAQITVAFYYSWAVTLVCLAGIPILVAVGGVFSNPINKRILASKELLDTISEKASWVLASLSTVKIFQRELFEWESVNSQLVDQQRLSLRFWLLSHLQQGLCRAIVLLIFVQGFYFGSYMVKHHGIKAGSVVTVFWSCLTASSQLQLLMSHLVEWSKGSASAERLQNALAVDQEQELFDSIGLMPGIQNTMLEKFKKYGWAEENYDERNGEQSVVTSWDSNSLNGSTSSFGKAIYYNESTKWGDENDVFPPPTGNIVFSDVVFSYPSRQEIVLAGLDLEIVSGSTVFVLGQSGSGKSTLASLLSRQYPWQAGEISIDGHDIHLLSQLWIEENIYICEQFPKMFDISINDNVRIGSSHPEHITDDQVEEALRESCADFVDTLLERGETVGATNLSGGQKQRIALARARLRNAPIMLYDEVTSALDSDLQAEVFYHLLKYRKGKTTIIITHDISVVPEGYPIFVIENGIASSYATLNDLKATLRNKQVFNFVGFREADMGAVPTGKRHHVPERSERRPVMSPIKPKPLVRTSPGHEFSFIYQTIPAKCAFVIGMLISVIHAVINPVFSYIFSKLVMGILDVNSKNTTMWAMLVLACAFIDGIVSIGKYVINIASESWLCSIRSMLFERVIMSERSNWRPELASYYLKMFISDSEKCAEIITLYWPGLASMVSLGMVGFIWALTIGWKLTLVGSSILPIFVAINQLYKYMSTKWTKEREARRSKVVQLMIDLTSESGFRTVKVQHLEHYFQTVYGSAEASLQRITPFLVMQIGIGYGTLKCFPYALESLLLWYGMRLVGLGAYTAQQTMTVFSLLMFTIITIDQLTSSIGSIGPGFEALSRLIEVLRELDPANRNEDDFPLVTPKINGEEPVWESVHFCYVGITYRNGTNVLGSFNQKFYKNELVAIVGPSGIGKSSIANMLVRMQQPTSGEIVIDSKWDMGKMSIADVRRNVSVVSQSPLDFFDGTVKENLLYGLAGKHDPRYGDLVDVCKSCGVHEFVMGLEDGYETRIKSGMLSGGQQQRLGIARSLIRDPKVLVLDECTSSLDAESKEVIKSLILKLHRSRNMIIVLITHQMDVAEIADRIVQL